ncbi:MAG: GntR family transcriptional regulator [Massiliimalia sp.]|jgi:GntR family transcriptional regulator of arabinose operon
MAQKKPKHQLVSDWVKERITNGTFPNGSRLLSENELAQQFEISRQTVRQAIGTLVNEGLLERHRGSGTYVCYEKKPPRNSTKNIGVITTYLNEYIFPGVIKGIDQVLSKNGYQMNLGITYNKTLNEQTVLSSMLSNGVDGFIIEPTKSAFPNPNIGLYREIVRQHIPVVFINGYYAALDFPYVTMDDYSAGKLDASHLIEKGHKKLFGIFKSDDIQGHFRYSGFVSAMQDHGLEFDDSRILWYVTEDLQQMFSPDNDRYLLERIGDSTGIVCYNDEIAVKLLEVLKRHGKQVPEDYSLVSFDNSNLCGVGEVGITSIDYPSQEIGSAAAEKMIQILNGENVKLHFSMKPYLVERNSVKNLLDEKK